MYCTETTMQPVSKNRNGSQNRVWLELKSYSSACPSPSHGHEGLEDSDKKEWVLTFYTQLHSKFCKRLLLDKFEWNSDVIKDLEVFTLGEEVKALNLDKYALQKCQDVVSLGKPIGTGGGTAHSKTMNLCIDSLIVIWITFNLMKFENPPIPHIHLAVEVHFFFSTVPQMAYHNIQTLTGMALNKAYSQYIFK